MSNPPKKMFFFQFLPRMPEILGLKTFAVPPEYIGKFNIAEKMFSHQTVFDPRTLKAVPLNPSLGDSETPLYP